MTLFHDVIPAGQWIAVTSPGGAQSIRARVLNAAGANNRIRMALVPAYQANQAPTADQFIEYDAGMLPDGHIDNTQLILPTGCALMAWAESTAVLRVASYPLADRFVAFWPSALPPIGAYARLAVATVRCEVVLRCCNLDPAPVVASVYVCGAGYVEGAAPPAARLIASNVTIPAAGGIGGGVFEEANLALDPGESIVLLSGGRLASRVHGINR